MRLINLAFSILAGEAALVFAAPAGSDPNVCCCCDISQPAIVCTTSIDIALCSCLAVECPADAPVIWRDLDEQPPGLPTPPTPTPEPTLPAEGDTADCCCCNIGKGAIVCDSRPADEGCICPLVLCPSDAPTIRAEPDMPMPTPTPRLAPSPAPQPPVDAHNAEESLAECCCCDSSQPAISCHMVPEEEGCFCAAVVCPEDAPTIWPEGMPEMTSMPEAPAC